jgi:hypothetical protein
MIDTGIISPLHLHVTATILTLCLYIWAVVLGPTGWCSDNRRDEWRVARDARQNSVSQHPYIQGWVQPVRLLLAIWKPS